jgi:hypothetical protein
MNFMNNEHRTLNTERRTDGLRRMLSLWGVLAVGVVLGTGAQTNANSNTNATRAATTNSASAEDTVPALLSFKIIGDNNIFDPYRRPRTEFQTNRITPRVPAFALTGTMSYSKGKFAFFNGTSQEYYKVLGVGGNIAGYTIKDITQTNVTLAANGKDFQMPVGQQLRNENGNWKLLGQPIEELNADTNSDDATANADAATPPRGANAEMSEVLKRLMQAREQELK